MTNFVFTPEMSEHRTWVSLFQRLNPDISQLVLWLVEQLVIATEHGQINLLLNEQLIQHDCSLTINELQKQLELCPQVRKVYQQDADVGQALVLDQIAGQMILYWRRYYLCEQFVLEQIHLRATTPSQYVVEQTFLAKLLPYQEKDSNNFWPAVACALALRRQFCVITGGPGCGKTYTAGIYISYLLHQKPNLQFALTAPTGKAANNLLVALEKILKQINGTSEHTPLKMNLYGGQELTIHRLLGAQADSLHLKYHANNQLNLDLVIVDEASMVDLVMLQALLKALPPTCQLLLLGDKDQLASVLPGSVFAHICQLAQDMKYQPETQDYLHQQFGLSLPKEYCAEGKESNFGQQIVALQINRRATGPVINLAQAVLHNRQPRSYFNKSNESLNYFPQLQMSKLLQYVLSDNLPSWQTYFATLLQLQESNFSEKVQQLLSNLRQLSILCVVHQGMGGTEQINQNLAKYLQKKYRLEKLNADWVHGSPAMITKNQADLDLVNGDQGIVLRNPDGNCAFWYLRNQIVQTVPLNRVRHILKMAYASSVHKAQGQEYSHTILILPATDQVILTRELIYTAVTRAKTHFTLIECTPGLFELALTRYGGRNSGLLF